MRTAFEVFIGTTNVRTRGIRPERLLNLLTSRGIPFRNAYRDKNGDLCFRIERQYKNRVKAYSLECSLEAEFTRIRGVMTFAAGFKKRYVLLAGLFSVIFAAYTASLFVWDIDISGNKRVKDTEILSALSEAGFSVGVFGPKVDREYIRGKVQYSVRELSWLTINIKGCRAQVLVRERREAPEITDMSLLADIKAEKTGVIISVDDFSGTALVDKGDTVLKGQILVIGQMTGRTGEVRPVRAIADVTARTWYQFSASMPLLCMGKNYTGEELERCELILADKRLRFYFGSGNPDGFYDKIVENKEWNLFGDFLLPFRINRIKYSFYKPYTYEISEEIAERQLKERLYERLTEAVNNGSIVQAEYITRRDGDLLTVTLSAECAELISQISVR